MTGREKIVALITKLRADAATLDEGACKVFEQAYKCLAAADGLTMCLPRLSDEDCEKVAQDL